MNSLVIGRGQVGQALVDILECQSYDLQDSGESYVNLDEIDTLHIAIPWSTAFPDVVRYYIEHTAASLTIVYSTVPIGTCEGLGVVHSPVEGQHPYLRESIELMPRWLGSSDTHLLDLAETIWENLGVGIHSVNNADITEYLKLRSTARYGINIAFADYEANVANALGIDYDLVAEFDENYNKLYEDLGVEYAKRYILQDPHGFIGGHCIVPNAKLLYDQFPSPLLYEILRLG